MDRFSYLSLFRFVWSSIIADFVISSDDSQKPEGKYTDTFIRNICFARVIVVRKKNPICKTMTRVLCQFTGAVKAIQFY